MRIPSLPLTVALAAAVSLVAAPAALAQSAAPSPSAPSSPGAALPPPCATASAATSSPAPDVTVAPSASASPAAAASPGAPASPAALASPAAPTPLALTRAQIKIKGEARASAVAAGPDGLIVVATTPAFLPSTVPSQIWTTTDGLSFKAAKLPGAKGAVITSVASTADGFVAVGFVPTPSTGLIWVSADGKVWQQAGKVPGVTFLSVVSAPGGVLIGGTIPRGDGTAQPGVWSLAPGGTPMLFDIAGNGNVSRIVATSDGGWLASGQEAVKQTDGTFTVAPHLWSSPDCVTWTSTTVPGAATWINMLATVNGTLLLSTIEGTAGQTTTYPLWTSTDGVTWRKVFETSGGALASVVPVDGGAIGFVSGGQVLSSDLATWQQVPDPTFKDAFPGASVSTPEGLVVVVGGTSSRPYHAMVWTTRPEPAAP